MAKIHVHCLVAAFGGNSTLPADCALVLAHVPPAGTEVLLVEMQFDVRRGGGERKTRVFAASVVSVETSDENVTSARVLVQDLHEMRMLDGMAMMSKEPHNENADWPVLDRIGSHSSGEYYERRVVIYQRTPQNEFLVERLLRQREMLHKRDAEVASLREALTQCVTPDAVRQFASALTPATLHELLKLARRSAKLAPEQG